MKKAYAKLRLVVLGRVDGVTGAKWTGSNDYLTECDSLSGPDLDPPPTPTG